MNEIDRIKDAYKRRDRENKKKLYSFLNPASLYSYHQRETELLKVIDKLGINDLGSMKILEIGCGAGEVLRSFIKYGFEPENIFGVDVLPDRIETAQRLSPNINLKCINAEELPFENEAFDMVLFFTVFTSIFDKNMKENLANEALRVLKKGGTVIYYDYQFNNPKNPDVKAVKPKEIYSLFPGCEIDIRRVTLAPPIARMFAPYSYLLCYLLEKIPLLRTHLFVTIKKNRGN